MASFAVYRKDKRKGYVPLLHPTEAMPVITEAEAREFMASHTEGHDEPDIFKIVPVPDHPNVALVAAIKAAEAKQAAENAKITTQLNTAGDDAALKAAVTAKAAVNKAAADKGGN